MFSYLPHLFFDEKATSFTCKNFIHHPRIVVSPLGGSDSSHDGCKEEVDYS